MIRQNPTPRRAAARLRIARISNGLSPQQVAVRSNITVEDVLALESGEIENLRADRRLSSVLDVIGVSSEYILGARGIG